MKETNQTVNVNAYVKMLEEWFAKFPPLPDQAKDVVVKVMPWIALVFGILGILGFVAATGLLSMMSPFMMLGGGLGMTIGGLLSGLLGIVGSVLMLISFSGLKSRKIVGWRWAFYAESVFILSNLITLNLFGAVLSFLIGFYFLFQVKSYYK